MASVPSHGIRASGGLFKSSNWRLKRRPAQAALVALLAIALLAGCVCSLRVGWLALSLGSRAMRVRAMAAEPRQVKLAALAQEIHGARQELSALRGAFLPWLWLSARVGGEPGVAASLVDAAVECAAAGDEAAQALAPALGDLSLASLSMAELPHALDALAQAQPALKRAQTRLDAAAAALARAPHSRFARVEQGVTLAKKLVTMAQQGLGAALIAPEMLGQTAPRTYLVLVQNSDELRATGGFISTVGRIVISRGAVVTQTFEDSYAVDDFTHPYPDPPKPLLDYMSLELWVFRDANWSPDFPTSARDAIRLYQISRPGQIDGVIAINQKAIQPVIAALEPIQVEGMPEPLTSANVERMFHAAWNPGKGESNDAWMSNRKKFIGATVRAMMDRLQSGNVNWARLGQGALDTLNKRQVLLYSAGPAAAELARLKWDGALCYLGCNDDYLMIVEANLGYAKTNPLISQSVDYYVEVWPDGTGRAVATVNYAHRGTQTGVVCKPLVVYDENVTYEKMMQRCHADYVRLVAPPGSRLRAATPHPVPGAYLISGKPTDGQAQTLANEVGWSVFGQFFFVEYGQKLQTRIDYDLPVVTTAQGKYHTYSLVLQKQSGADALPVHVTLTLPGGARVLSADPRPTLQASRWIEFDLTLDMDRRVEVVYELAR